MACEHFHRGPFLKSPNPRIHGWIHPVWLRCSCCGSDISPKAVRHAIFRAARWEEEPHDEDCLVPE